jgi:hypothetical protein
MDGKSDPFGHTTKKELRNNDEITNVINNILYEIESKK